MNSIVYLFALLFILFCFVMIGGSNVNTYYIPLVRQFVAEKYPSVGGEVLESDIYSLTNSRGVIKYRANVEYQYHINSQNLKSNRIRYLGDMSYAESSNYINDIVIAYPKDSPVHVFYNPKDAADALLSPGFIGDDVLGLLKQLAFYYIGLLLTGVCFVRLYRIICRPLAGGVKLIYKGGGVQVQLPVFSPAALALIAGIISLACLSSFSNSKHVSFICGIAELCFNFVIVFLVYFWARHKVQSGLYNLEIDRDIGTIILPKTFGCKDRLSLKISDISAIVVNVETLPGKNITRSFVPSFKLQSKGSKPIKIVKWNEPERAEAFAVWLRGQLGL